MKSNINAENILFLGVEYLQAEQAYHVACVHKKQYRKHPFCGNFSAANAAVEAAYETYHKTTQTLFTVGDVTGIPWHVIRDASKAAYRWYLRTNWQYCLNENADRLLIFFVARYSRDPTT